jgi:hypothetical protein
VLGEMRLKPLEVGGVYDHREVVQVLEVLGFDASPSADMWRTIMWPTKYLQRRPREFVRADSRRR